MEKGFKKIVELVGAMNSVHNDAKVQLQSFQNQKKSVSHQLGAHSHEMVVEYRTHLIAVLDVMSFLLK